MDDVIWQCPNCGSATFTDIPPNKRRCEYCGTTLTIPRWSPDTVTCPKCGVENEPHVSYCTECGYSLTGQPPIGIQSLDPAVLSIIVSIAGSLLFPIVGNALGLYLAYRALQKARTQGGNEQLARSAVIVGWIAIGMTLLPTCMGMGVWGCGGIMEILSQGW